FISVHELVLFGF
ncbi:hypothetical protein N499_1064B, partial [Wolbachia pipientis wVitA]